MLDINVNVVILIAFVSAILLYLRHYFTYWRRHGVAGPNFITIKEFTTKLHVYHVEHLKKYGRIFGSYDVFRKELTVNEPDLIRDILVKDFHVFPDRRNWHTGSTLLGLSLFMISGDDRWRRIRSVISPAFTSGKLRLMMNCMHDIADKLVANIEKVADNGEAVDMRKYIGAYTMDVITSCAYGVNTDSVKDPNHPMIVNARKILGLNAHFSLIVSVIAPAIARLLRLEPFDINSVNYFDFLTNKIIEERKRLQKQDNYIESNKRTDFLQLMLDTEREAANGDYNDSKGDEKRKSERTLTPDEVTAQGILFFIAGYDTTTSALTHCIYHLANNPECQQVLYEELKTVQVFDYETINQLKYLNAVVLETLRYSPPLVSVERECTQDYKLGHTGITIPAGTSVVMRVYGLHHDPQFFDSPEQFRPERFLRPQHHAYAFLPFGGGQRNCIGMRLALNEMKACVATLVRKFMFELKPGFQLDYFNGSLILNPKELMVFIKTRN